MIGCNKAVDEYEFKVILIMNYHSPSTIVCVHWGCKKITPVHLLARHATLLTRLQYGLHNIDDLCHNYKTDNLRRSTGCSVDKAHNINADSLSLMRSSRKKLSSSRFPSTAMPMWPQQLQHPWQWFPPLSATSIDNSAFSRFFLANSHRPNQWNVIPPDLLRTLFDTHEASLLPISRRPQKYPLNAFTQKFSNEEWIRPDDAAFDRSLEHVSSYWIVKPSADQVCR